MFTFTDWYATLWDKIDVDFLVEETKKLTKDIKQLNKAVRNYEVYRYALHMHLSHTHSQAAFCVYASLQYKLLGHGGNCSYLTAFLFACNLALTIGLITFSRERTCLQT